MSEFIPTTSNLLPVGPMQPVEVITEDFSRMKLLSRFAPNIKRKITAYRLIETTINAKFLPKKNPARKLDKHTGI